MKDQINNLGFEGQVGFPGSSAGKESACNARDPGLIPESRRSTGEGIGYSWLQSPSAVILEPQKIKSASVSSFPIYLP